MDGDFELKARYQSSPNIAWVKYWGKYDEDYILPINDSLGLTLNPSDIHTLTDITFSSQLTADLLFLNHDLHPLSKRMQKMFNRIKHIVYQRKFKNVVTEEKWHKYHFQVKSVNSFPTASGMASSASGLACLAAALNGLFDNLLTQNQLSELARLGSGSASRSICGGLVRWKGVSEQIFEGSIPKTPELLQNLSRACVSETVIEESQLRNVKVLILLANNKQKQVSSTSGMQQSTQTSQLIKQRNSIAKTRIEKILNSWEELNKSESEEERVRIFNEVMVEIIKDSNQFHAICLDTYPPIFYLNQFSRQIITIIDQCINPSSRYKVAYTFDAGPHAFLFLHQSVLPSVLQYFVSLFKTSASGLNKKARDLLPEAKIGDFKQYKGEIINPYEIWVTDVGCRSTRIDL